ncbi:MAG: universal stress protein [Rhodothermales bacterium]|nr:universal stress protein [Rhodothermales bacterium]
MKKDVVAVFKPERVLVAVDFSPASESALESALDFVGSRPVELHLIHVQILFDEAEEVAGKEREIAAEAERLYGRVTKQRKIANGTKVSYSVERDVAPASAILRYAAAHDIEMIVSGTHGRRGFRRMILGSVAEELVRLSECPVLTIGGEASHHLGEHMKSIVVPVDFSEESARTLSVSRQLAFENQATLEILHVVEETMHPAFYNTGVFSVYDLRPDLDKRALEEMEKLFAEAAGPSVDATFALRQGHAAREIIEYAGEQQCDLIVMSTHGLTGLSHVLIGSVAESVVRTAPCPVLILPRRMNGQAEDQT